MNEKLHGSQVAIILFMTQSGIMLFSLPRLVAEAFGTNGWAGLLIISGIVAANLYLIYLVYKKGEGRAVFDILEEVIPKFILVPIYVVAILMYSIIAIMVANNYVLLVKLMMFQEINVNILIVVFLLAVLFLINKGIYNMAKATVVFFFLTVWTFLLLLIVIPEFDFVRMTPFFFKGDLDIWGKGIEVYTAFLGYLLMIFLIPYVQKDAQYGKAIFIGHFFTTFVYLIVCIVSFGFFSFNQLTNILYPTLKILKYMQTPLIERIENITFSIFFLSLLVTCSFYYWICIEFAKRILTKTNENWLILGVVTASFIFSLFFDVKREIDAIMNMAVIPYMFFAFLLPALVLFILWYKKSKAKGMGLNG